MKINRYKIFPLLILFSICIVFYSKIVLNIGWFWDDLIHQEFPHRVFAQSCFLHFQFPHWNPYTFGGMPFFAAIHTGVLYPSNVLLSFLPISQGALWYLIELFIVLHIFIAGVNMYLFTKDNGISIVPSLLSGIGFMLCAFFVTHSIHSMMIYILCWLPLIMLLIRRGILNNDLKSFIISGMILGISVFAGHPQITFYEFIFLSAYSIYLFSYERSAKKFIYLLIPFVIAIGISLIQILPALELGKESVRTDWTFIQASEGSLSLRQLFSFIIPKIFGSRTCSTSDIPFWLNDSFHSGYWTYWETAFYVGLPILILGLYQFINIRRNKFVLFCFIWFLISLAIATGNNGPLYGVLFNYIPGFDKFRMPGRLLFTWDLLLPLLAAMTLEQLGQDYGRKKILKGIFIIGGIVSLLGIIVLSGFIKVFWVELNNNILFSNAQQQTLIMLLFLIMLLASSLFLYKNEISFNQFKFLILSITVADLFMYGINTHVQSNENAIKHYSMNSKIATLLKKDNKELFRSNVRDFDNPGFMVLRRNQGMIDKIQLLEGYNPLQLSRRLPPCSRKLQLDLLNTKYITSASENFFGPCNRGFLSRYSLFYRTKMFNNDSSLIKYMNSEEFKSNYSTELLLEKEAKVDSTCTYGNIKMIKYENNEIIFDVYTKGAAVFWMSEIYYPAWKAYIDRKRTEIFRADYSFRAIEVPIGHHTIMFKYQSGYFTIGVCTTVITIILSLLWLFFMPNSGHKKGKLKWSKN